MIDCVRSVFQIKYSIIQKYIKVNIFILYIYIQNQVESYYLSILLDIMFILCMFIYIYIYILFGTFTHV